MELRQLAYFVAVAEEASFTRAAARVHVSQSGVSAQVRRLEQQLGQPLFDRRARNPRLTPAGEAVLPLARSALASVAAAREVVDELAGLVRGHVRVGMVSGCTLPVLSDLLATFHADRPGISVTLTEAASDTLVDALAGGQLDLALIGSAGPATSGLATVVVADEPLVAIPSPEDVASRRRSIGLAALAGQPLVCLPKGTGVRAALDQACATAGLVANVVMEASALTMVARLSAAGMGWAVLPASAAAAHDLQAIQITRPALRSRLELAWPADPPASAAARALTVHAGSVGPQLRS